MAHQRDHGCRGRHGRSSVPPPFEIKTGTYTAHRRPVRSHRRALPPSARRTTTPAHHSQLCPCSCCSSALDACRCVCLHICGLSADGAGRSAAAPARLAQPRTITFQILRKFDQKSGGRYSGVCGTKAVVFILYHPKYRGKLEYNMSTHYYSIRRYM